MCRTSLGLLRARTTSTLAHANHSESWESLPAFHRMPGHDDYHLTGQHGTRNEGRPDRSLEPIFADTEGFGHGHGEQAPNEGKLANHGLPGRRCDDQGPRTMPGQQPRRPPGFDLAAF